jgi:hypothetical protein
MHLERTAHIFRFVEPRLAPDATVAARGVFEAIALRTVAQTPFLQIT